MKKKLFLQIDLHSYGCKSYYVKAKPGDLEANMRRRDKAALIILACLAITLAAVAIFLVARSTAASKHRGDPAAETVASSMPSPSPETTPTPTMEPTPSPAPDPTVPVQPEQAPSGYFADAAFLGNSVVTGLNLYDSDKVLTGAAFYAANSVTVLSVDDYVNQMSSCTYGKIYIGLGLNEVNYDRDVIRASFVSLVQRLQQDHPGAIIYLMAVTPVSLDKSSNSTNFTKDLVVSFNQMLYEIAQQTGVYYMDDYTALSDENGYLPADVTSDGIHFTAAHYELWFNYLLTHYIPVAAGTASTETPTGN
jgi:hypothetical protein